MTKTEEALNKLVEMREDDIIAKTLLLCRSYAIREGSDYGVSIAEEAIIEYANTRTPEGQEMWAVECEWPDGRGTFLSIFYNPEDAELVNSSERNGCTKVVPVIVTKKED